ncbi:MAG: phosphatidylethanolamine/phosphatidyl-N-methylethanolamine N-methyltransferase [Psychromonas sp.]|jgi:phosphatidylethanolamine/phosphatidyl-N-methylethanolamine N-methyltransferase
MPQILKQAISNFKETGSIAPSSKKLAERIVENAHLESKKVIVEFGPGTGVITREILKRKPKDALYFALELNPDLVKETQKNCPEALVFCDSATNISKYLKEMGATECDCIISGLPFANFEEDLQDQILSAASNSLSSNGVFLTFVYNMSLVTKAGKLFRKKLPAFFSSVRRGKTIWANLPPAFIYRASK